MFAARPVYPDSSRLAAAPKSAALGQDSEVARLAQSNSEERLAGSQCWAFCHDSGRAEVLSLSSACIAAHDLWSARSSYKIPRSGILAPVKVKACLACP